MACAADGAWRPHIRPAHQSPPALPRMRRDRSLPLGPGRRPRRVVLQPLRGQGPPGWRWLWPGPADARARLGPAGRLRCRRAAPRPHRTCPRSTDHWRRSRLALQRHLRRLPLPREAHSPPLVGRHRLALEGAAITQAAVLGTPGHRCPGAHHRRREGCRRRRSAAHRLCRRHLALRLQGHRQSRLAAPARS